MRVWSRFPLIEQNSAGFLWLPGEPEESQVRSAVLQLPLLQPLRLIDPEPFLFFAPREIGRIADDGSAQELR